MILDIHISVKSEDVSMDDGSEYEWCDVTQDYLVVDDEDGECD